MNYLINKNLAKLSPKEFEKWYKSRNFEGDWEVEYKKIGGKLSEPRKIRKQSEKG